jgi:hypothetical protein
MNAGQKCLVHSRQELHRIVLPDDARGELPFEIAAAPAAQGGVEPNSSAGAGRSMPPAGFVSLRTLLAI